MNSETYPFSIRVPQGPRFYDKTCYLIRHTHPAGTNAGEANAGQIHQIILTRTQQGFEVIEAQMFSSPELAREIETQWRQKENYAWRIIMFDHEYGAHLSLQGLEQLRHHNPGDHIRGGLADELSALL